ncbi:protein odr-4 homolog isoform X2 [Chenopodium quinoa]|uniref:protein odr-4 homolog isoform X2 n=1 Tax=Chenopodium quinoa TaxID=63459 RepID=UPI000B77F5D3|nr:protein odr-4 homolog isoform X2 [Chenopodium quinoa]
MVKAVVGEETRLQLAEDRLAQSAIPAQVGLVIGKLNSKLDRGFIFDLVPTPPNDAGDPPCSIIDPLKGAADKKKVSKPKSSVDSSSLSIDKEWVAEHARQVSRLLVGGVKVVGIYVWVGETSFKNSTLVLCQTVTGVADAAPLLENGSDEMLLLHISYSPRRWTCRNCSVSSNITSSSLRPCDFKLGKVLNSLQTFRCIYSFCMRLPFTHENMSKAKLMNDVLLDGISNHVKELKGAKAIVDGDLVDVITDGSCASGGVHEVEILFPFMKDTSSEASSQNNVVGILVFSGTVCSYSYLNSKEPISQAVADIKEDIIMSLRTRLDMITDEADRETATASENGSETYIKTSKMDSINQIIQQPLRKQCMLTFPRRVFIPWLAGTFVCDYLLPAESFEALSDHLFELLSMEAPEGASTFLQPENELPNLTAKPFWNVVAPSYQISGTAHIVSQSKKSQSDPKKSIAKNVNALVAGFILLIAIMLGSVFYARSFN